MSGLRLRNIDELIDSKTKQCDIAEVQQKLISQHKQTIHTTSNDTTTTTTIKENHHDEIVEISEEKTPQITKTRKNCTANATVKTTTTTATTTQKRAKTKTPPPNQMRIDTFFKSASKTFLVNIPTTTTTTAKKLTKTKKKKKSRTPKRRKLEFDDEATTSTTTTTTTTMPDSDSTYKPCSSTRLSKKPSTVRRRRPTPRNSAEIKPAQPPQSPDIVIDLCAESDNDGDVNNVSAASNLAKKSSAKENDMPFVSIPPTMYRDVERHLLPATYISKESVLSAQTPDLTKLFPDGSNWTERELAHMERDAEKTVATTKPNKPCPSYKVIRGTSFAVDAFQFGDILGVTHYFLTHFHSDHYVGLTKKFAKPLYMSRITANLVRSFMGIACRYIHVLPMNETVKINHIEITAIDANHCPGAIMLVFKLPSGRCILHTGDFRANHQMESEPIFWNNNIDLIYLDTTYLSMKPFCTQHESIENAKAIINKFRITHGKKRILYVCGAYLIGKERFWSALAEEYQLSVWTEDNRRKALEAMGEEQFLERLVEDPYDADMHVIAMGKVSYWPLSDYFDRFHDHYDCMLALRPSGWEKPATGRARMLAKINVVGIEYSEHSSNVELERFVKFLKPREVISTVPVNQSDLHITPQVPQKWYKYDKLLVVTRNYQPSITNYLRLHMETRRNIRNNIQNTVVRTPRMRRTKSSNGFAGSTHLSTVHSAPLAMVVPQEAALSQSPPTEISTAAATVADDTNAAANDDDDDDDDTITKEKPNSKIILNLDVGNLKQAKGDGHKAIMEKWIENSAISTCRRLFNQGGDGEKCGN